MYSVKLKASAIFDRSIGLVGDPGLLAVSPQFSQS